MDHYVRYRMQYSERSKNNFLDQLFPMQKSKALHHVRQIRVYPPRRNWESIHAPNNMIHLENAVVGRNTLLYPNDYLRVLRNVLN